MTRREVSGSPQAPETFPDDATEAVAAINAAYGPALFAFAYRGLGDRQAAEEVVQDTLVRAWRNADRFDPARGSLQTWLYAIAHNLIVDQHRRRGARPATTELVEAELSPRMDSDDLDRAMEAWQVAEALQRLSPAHREVVVEAFYRGSSVAEAASRLGIPAGTVKSRLYYALRALRLTLEELGVVG